MLIRCQLCSAKVNTNICNGNWSCYDCLLIIAFKHVNWCSWGKPPFMIQEDTLTHFFLLIVYLLQDGLVSVYLLFTAGYIQRLISETGNWVDGHLENRVLK